MTINLKSSTDLRIEISERLKSLRLAERLTQSGLALRSGVSLGSLKRFERTGQISLESLLKLALVLDALDGFEKLFLKLPNLHTPLSLDQIMEKKKIPKRGRLK